MSNSSDTMCFDVSGLDKNVGNVMDRFYHRARHGFDKYGVTTERTDLSTLEWLTHLQEELMDATIYVERLKQEFNQNNFRWRATMKFDDHERVITGSSNPDLLAKSTVEKMG